MKGIRDFILAVYFKIPVIIFISFTAVTGTTLLEGEQLLHHQRFQFKLLKVTGVKIVTVL